MNQHDHASFETTLLDKQGGAIRETFLFSCSVLFSLARESVASSKHEPQLLSPLALRITTHLRRDTPKLRPRHDRCEFGMQLWPSVVSLSVCLLCHPATRSPPRSFQTVDYTYGTGLRGAQDCQLQRCFLWRSPVVPLPTGTLQCAK